MKLRGLYAITPEDTETPSLMRKVRAALAGGIAALQYRNKTAVRSRRLVEAKELAELCRPYGVPLIINDDVGLALEVDAAGAHLGRDDGDLAAARAKLAGKLMGASCYNDARLARNAVAAGADYVAFGSVFVSPTKPAAVRAALSLFSRDFPVPLCAIGGITLENAPPLIAAGADLLAVISDLFDAPDIAARAVQYRKLFL
jgi:thiamine-phosphate pyrophosphorylase